MALAPGECHVWWTRPDAATEDMARLLDPDELARRERLVRADDRLRYLAAHALARQVLAGYLDSDPETVRFRAPCDHCGGEHGKPHLAEPRHDLHLSLSHSGDRVVVAVARGVPVGVDVERIGTSRDYTDLLDAVLSTAEQRRLEEMPADTRSAGFFRYWVRKEAILKATGDGLGVSPALLTVSAPDQPARLLAWRTGPGPEVRVQLADLAAGDGHVGCVALVTMTDHLIVEHDGTPLLCRTWTDG